MKHLDFGDKDENLYAVPTDRMISPVIHFQHLAERAHNICDRVLPKRRVTVEQDLVLGVLHVKAFPKLSLLEQSGLLSCGGTIELGHLLKELSRVEYHFLATLFIRNCLKNLT